MSTKTSVIIVLVIIAVLSLGFWAMNKPKSSEMAKQNDQAMDTNHQADQPNQKEPVITKVETSKLPDKFPADFPIEAGAEITTNFNSQTDTGLQATREFISKKTLAENYKFYGDYLKNNGWEIISTSDEKTLKSIFAKKGNMTVSVNINQNSITKKNVITISFSTAM